MRDPLIYLGTGIFALCLAVLGSSAFMPRALSQAPPPTAVAPSTIANTPGTASGPNSPKLGTPVSNQGGTSPTANSNIFNGASAPGSNGARSQSFGNSEESGVPSIPSFAPPSKQVITTFDSSGNQVSGNGFVPPPGIEVKIPNLLVGIIEDYNYNPTGKRDPFLPLDREEGAGVPMGPLWPLQKFDLEQLRLVGIIWDVRAPKAMILDPGGRGYVVTLNERVGRNNGYIARIREGEIVVVESVLASDGKPSYVTKLMKLNPQ